jgi:hypothetical protein
MRIHTASPHAFPIVIFSDVVGIAAGILSANPGLTPAQVASVIVSSGSQLDGMLLATASSNYCGTIPPTQLPTPLPTPPPTNSPTPKPTPQPTPPPTQLSTSKPTPTCIHKNKYLGLAVNECGGRRPLNAKCCSGRCWAFNGKALCR